MIDRLMALLADRSVFLGLVRSAVARARNLLFGLSRSSRSTLPCSANVLRSLVVSEIVSAGCDSAGC